MRKFMHVCQSVSGALKNWSEREWRMVAMSNDVSVAALKERFRIYEFEGKNVIPIGEPCEGFSFETGCPGHFVEEDKP